MHRRCKNCQSFSVCDIEDDGFLLFEDAQDLKLAAGGGQSHPTCDLCAIIWWSLRHEWRKRPLNRGHGEFFEGEFNVRVYRNPPRGAGAIQRVDILVMPAGSSHNLSWMPAEDGSWRIGPPNEKPSVLRSHLTVYSDTTCETRRTSSDAAFCLPAANSGSPQCLELVSQWLTDCMESHGTKCSGHEDAFLPKRVIEIGKNIEDGSLSSRLVTTNGDCGRYLALSYCWGSGPFFILTNNNIQDLHQSILPTGLLPQTIVDAILLTKHLGFRYLWVDSLCIIQGSDAASKADWEEQSQDMGGIYRSASLTVAAAAAKDCRDGLFHARPGPETSYCPVLQKQESDEIVYLGPDMPNVEEQIEPLSQRGWALQEAVLSRRLITFGTTEMSWECSCCSCRETVKRALPKQTASTSVLGTASEIHSSWANLVEEYSRRDLTFQTDKLPAISGLAAVVSEALGYKFHHGIWQDQAPHLLMWKHVGGKRGEDLVFSRQKTPRAPTWSWASVDGGVEFLKGAVGPARLDIRGKSIFITGRLSKIDSIRHQIEGYYYGGYEQYRPWMAYPTTMKTFVDDLNDIPEANRNSPGSGQKELVNVWFLFLGKSEGLILIPIEHAANETKRFGGENMRRFQNLVSGKSHSLARFRRVGAFIGYNEPRTRQDHIETVEIL